MAARRWMVIVFVVVLLMALMIPVAGAVSNSSDAAAKTGAGYSQTIAARQVCPFRMCPYGFAGCCSGSL